MLTALEGPGSGSKPGAETAGARDGIGGAGIRNTSWVLSCDELESPGGLIVGSLFRECAGDGQGEEDVDSPLFLDDLFPFFGEGERARERRSSFFGLAPCCSQRLAAGLEVLGLE